MIKNSRIAAESVVICVSITPPVGIVRVRTIGLCMT